MASSKQNKTQKLEPSSSKKIFLATTLLAGFLLVIANSALWINRTVFDSSRFSSIATGALVSESSRQAIASEIVDQALADKPIVRNIAGPTAANMISGLLDSSQAQTALQRAVSQVHSLITTQNPSDVVIDLSGIKSIAARVVTLTSNEDTNEALSKIPDTLTIIEAKSMPNYYQYAIVLVWLGPVALLAALFVLAGPHLRLKKFSPSIALIQGAAIVGTSLVALLLGPLFRPPLLARISEPNYRTVTQNIYDSLINTFNMQTLWLVAFGLILATVALALLSYRYALSGRRPVRSK